LRSLARNDSLIVFEIAGGSVETGPTGTNVNDVYIAVRAKNRFDNAAGRGS
jgi:glycerate-2-kinase